MTFPFNVLAQRYASLTMVERWSETKAVIDERGLWTDAIDIQEDLGVDTPEGAVGAYRSATTAGVDFVSIADRERVLQHDVMARRAEFNALAGFELAHRGFTSRDDTENLEQARILASLVHVRNRSYAVLARFRKRALEWKTTDVCGRSHGQPGQVTTYGKRIATLAEELMIALEGLDETIKNYRFRGFKGAMGTQQDIIALFGDKELARKFEENLCERLGFTPYFDSVGQIYPRSLDFKVIAALFQLSGAFGNFARMVRDNCRLRHMFEGFSEGRKGSSIMPHKQNPSKSERISSLKDVLRGNLVTATGLVGTQEFEGDVSCSVARRTMLADSFFTIDGMIETVLTVLDQMEIFPAVISAELAEELPFLSSTAIRAAIRKTGVDDTVAYEIIQAASTAASNDIRNGRSNTLLEHLANDGRVQLGIDELRKLCVPNHGDAANQVERVVARIDDILKEVPTDVIEYQPSTRN
jgi:adenylosuccinate lyase